MGWIFRTATASIGKKTIMALTGTLLGIFVVIHAAGNATALIGREAYIAYAAHLHAFDTLLKIFEALLAVAFILHAGTGIFLAGENILARPERYAVKRSSGGRTIGSGTMIFTGTAVLLFLPLHLFNFHFTSGNSPVADQIRLVLSNPYTAFVYMAVVICLAVHVSHGFWSLFQTLGLDHPKYTALIRSGALALSLATGVILALIPYLTAFYPDFLL